MVALRVFIICFLMPMVACDHDILDELHEDLEDMADAEVLYEGVLSSANNYTVTGKSMIVAKNNKKYLLFQMFSSTSGPDLKVYVSKDIKPTAHLVLGDLKAIIGTFNYELPASFDFDENGPYVLVYCERFSRLFGSAQLKPRQN